MHPQRPAQVAVKTQFRAAPRLAFDFEITGQPMALSIVVGKSCGASTFFWGGKIELRKGSSAITITSGAGEIIAGQVRPLSN